VLYKYLNRQLIIAFLLSLMAISSTLIPFTTSVWQLYTCALIFGTGTGAWIAAYNVWLIEIWQQKAGHVLFLSQLMYGTGAVLGPLLDRPYLTGGPKQGTNSTKLLNIINNTTDIIDVNERRSKLEVPFMVGGGIQIVCKHYI
jgi:hypothetical protein